MVSNTGTIERINTHTFLDEPPSAGKKVPSLGGSLVKFTLLVGLNRLTFGKFSCIRNAMNRASENLLKAGSSMLQDMLASSGISQQLEEMLMPIPSIIAEKVKTLQCKANPEGFKDRAINFVKSASGVDQVAQLTNEMVSTAIDLLTKTNSGESPDVLDRLLFIGGVLTHSNPDVKQVFDRIKSAALDKLFSPVFIKTLLKSCNLGKLCGLVNFVVSRFGVQNLVDRFLTDHLLTHPKFDMTRMELHDTHEILIAKGMQMFFQLDGPDWDASKVDQAFSDLVATDDYAKHFEERFESIGHLYHTSKLARTATNVAGLVLHDIVKPVALNVSSNIAQMTPEQFCELYQNPDQINAAKITGLLLGNNLGTAGRIEQSVDSFLQTINQISDAVHTASEKVQTVVDAGTKFIAEKFEAVKDMGHAAIQAAADTASSVAEAGKAAVSTVATHVADAAQAVKAKVVDTAQAVATTVGEKIESAKAAVTLDLDIDISDAFDGLDEELGWGGPAEAPSARSSASINSETAAADRAPSEIPVGVVSEGSIANSTPTDVSSTTSDAASIPTSTIAEVLPGVVPTLSAEELKAQFHPWDRPHTMAIQNQLNAAEVHDDHPIQDKGYTWTATYPLSDDARSAIENQRVNMYLEGGSMILDEKDRSKSLVTQLHNYVADNNSQNDATHVVTQFSKLLDGEHLKLFLPETLRDQVNNDPHIFVDVKSKHPLTFEMHASWQVDGHEIEVHFTADIKETVKKGWTGSTITGNFASISTTDSSQDSLRNIRYFLDNEPMFA